MHLVPALGEPMEDARRSAVEAIQDLLAAREAEITELKQQLAKKKEELEGLKKYLMGRIDDLLGDDDVQIINYKKRGPKPKPGSLTKKEEKARDLRIIEEYVRENGGSVKVTEEVTFRDIQRRGGFTQYRDGERWRQFTIRLVSESKAKSGIFHYDPATKILTLRS